MDMNPSVEFLFSKLLKYGKLDNQTALENLLNPIWFMNHYPWLESFISHTEIEISTNNMENN